MCAVVGRFCQSQEAQNNGHRFDTPKNCMSLGRNRHVQSIQECWTNVAASIVFYIEVKTVEHVAMKTP